MARNLSELMVLIRGGGEIASGIAHRLHQSHMRVCIAEIRYPQAVRREVSFSEAVYRGTKTVEGVTARLVSSHHAISETWGADEIPLIIDPEAKIKQILQTDVLVDAILAKKNLGTQLNDATLVIGIGPGFFAGRDTHVVIETNRGHNLGKVIIEGEAEPNTGIPAAIAGYAAERVLRTSARGKLRTFKNIGDQVIAGDVIATVNGHEIKSALNGVIRGLLMNGFEVHEGMKIGDIDPRGMRDYCYSISDKARAIAGGVLEAILMVYNR